MPNTIDHPYAHLLHAFVSAVRLSPHNLLSKRGLEELETRHVPECIAFAEQLPTDVDVLDLGTGGGFPGMVIAIARPDVRMTLLDGTRKKMTFLQDFAAAQGVSVRGIVGRAEEAAATHGRSFDIVTARAVAPLDRLVPWSVPFLRPGGELWAIKGERWSEEFEAAGPALARARASLHEVREPVQNGEVGGTGGAPRVVIIRVPG
jgi:16S rRNA (guanine527-N7)-methyltransferase